MFRLAISSIWAVFLLTVVSCSSSNLNILTADRKISLSGVDYYEEGAGFKVREFQVKAMERRVNGSIFNPKGGVRYNKQNDTYLFGTDITYEIGFEIGADSVNDMGLRNFKLDGIKVLTRRNDRSHEDSTVFDTVFIIPLFKKVERQATSNQLVYHKFRYSHRSSSRRTNVIFRLNTHEVLIRTQFAKPMVPGG